MQLTEFKWHVFILKAEEVRIELNKWASDHTNGLIRDILPPGFVTSKSVKVCGNALYFKGAWEKKFDKSLTKDKMFHLLVGKPVRVPFMSSHKDQYIKAYDGFKVLGLPYRQGRNDDTNRKFRCISIFRTRKMGWIIFWRKWHQLLDSWIVIFRNTELN